MLFYGQLAEADEYKLKLAMGMMKVFVCVYVHREEIHHPSSFVLTCCIC